jgi:hypothetical protein
VEKMNFKSYLLEADLQLYFDFMKHPKIGLEDAREHKFFGPVFHGTEPTTRQIIQQAGFKIFQGTSRTGPIKGGYELKPYYSQNVPPPVHHLGFGVYFTTSKITAKTFNQGTTKGLTEYMLDVPKLKTINFNSEFTMMNWWKANGYDMPSLDSLKDKSQKEIEDVWVGATQKMTNVLKNEYDAVYFKAKGFKRSLDYNQICVYDLNKIYELDKTLNKKFDIGNGIFVNVGDRIQIKDTKATAIINSIKVDTRTTIYYNSDPWNKVLGPSNYILGVRNLKNKQLIEDKYRNVILKVIMNLADNDDELFRTRMINSGLSKEETIKRYVDFCFDKLENQIPSKLVGKELKPGERLK